jgi:hypothetical protein
MHVEVAGKKELCRLNGKIERNLANCSYGRWGNIELVPNQVEQLPRMAVLRVNNGECAGGQM